MKYLIAWVLVAISLGLFWGSIFGLITRDIDNAIIAGGIAFFAALMLAGLGKSAKRRMTDGH
jgi:hypothetical protein